MVSQKNIHMVTLSDMGGAQKYVLGQALKDKANNIETLIVSEDNQGWLAQQAKANNITYKVIHNLKRSVHPGRDLLSLFEIIRLIKQEQPSSLYLNSSKIGFLGSLAGEICDLKNIIYTVHGWVFNEPMSFLQKQLYILLEKISARWKTKILFVSHHDLVVAKNLHIGDPNNFELIKLQIDSIDFFAKEIAQQKLFNNINADYKDKIVIGTIANAYPTKNLSLLIAIAKQLQKYDDLLFTIVGAGPDLPKLKELIAKYQLENVLLLGPINNAAQCLKAFDLFVLTSIKEGSPYVLLEAQQAGIPILATPVGGVPEMLSPEQLCQPNEFAHKIKTMFKLN